MENKEKMLLNYTKKSLKKREKIKANTYPNFIDEWFFKPIAARFTKNFDLYRDDQWDYFKARTRLANEMDIKKLIRNMRSLRNTLKMLTTKRERKLIRMQND